jgi:hypothetical protein
MKNPGASSWVSSFYKVWILCLGSYPQTKPVTKLKPEQAPGYEPRPANHEYFSAALGKKLRYYKIEKMVEEAVSARQNNIGHTNGTERPSFFPPHS